MLTFPEEGQTVAMLDTGDATYVELFSGGSGEKTSGSILHLALRTSDCDKATERRALQAALLPKSLLTWCSKAIRPYLCATPSAKGRTASKSSCSKPKRSDDSPHLEIARRSYNAQS